MNPEHHNGGLSWKALASISGIIFAIFSLIAGIQYTATVNGTVSGVRDVVIEQNTVSIVEMKKSIGELQEKLEEDSKTLALIAQRLEQMERREDRRGPEINYEKTISGISEWRAPGDWLRPVFHDADGGS